MKNLHKIKVQEECECDWGSLITHIHSSHFVQILRTIDMSGEPYTPKILTVCENCVMSTDKRL